MLMAVPIERLYDNPAVLHSNDTLTQVTIGEIEIYTARSLGTVWPQLLAGSPSGMLEFVLYAFCALRPMASGRVTHAIMQ